MRRIAASAELVWLGKMVIWYPGGQPSLGDRGNLFSNCHQLHCQRHHPKVGYMERKKINSTILTVIFNSHVYSHILHI